MAGQSNQREADPVIKNSCALVLGILVQNNLTDPHYWVKLLTHVH